MAVFNLPDEPNSPAGKAIQRANEPKSLESKAISNKFLIVFKSNGQLSNTVSKIQMDLLKNELTFTATETGEYKWIDWIMHRPNKEIVTLYLMDDEGKQNCKLKIEEIEIKEHECPISNENNIFGLDVPNNLEHKIKIQFNKIERISSEEGSKS
jgi:hypothetical protein